MWWIALSPHEVPQRDALVWQALALTPRVAWCEGLLVLEVSACLRLWGGVAGLGQAFKRIFEGNPALAGAEWSCGATSLIAIAYGRIGVHGAGAERTAPPALPLSTLGAAQAHRPMLARLGLRTWGDLQALPRSGVARRFGPALLEALDQALGQRPERHTWLQAPERFDERAELPAWAESLPGLAFAVQRLLAALCAWLRARQSGALAIEWRWRHELRRLDGVDVPPWGRLVLRSGSPCADMRHWQRLFDAHAARLSLAAPVGALRLLCHDSVRLPHVDHALLPAADEAQDGEAWPQLLERLAARLGPTQVQRVAPQADHRPERLAACTAVLGGPPPTTPSSRPSQVLRAGAATDARGSRITHETHDAPWYPTWLLPQPVPLTQQGERPCYHGPLQLLAGPQRIETGWWDGPPVLRDYFIAHNPQAGWVWIFRERPDDAGAQARAHGPRWFLQGWYG